MNFHRPFGVYGILVGDGKLLVIHKGGGPYKNRWDLPGGNLEERESLVEALQREFVEETGLQIEVLSQVGAFDFLIETDWRQGTLVHHIAILYLVKTLGGSISVPEKFDGQDSLGASWVSLENMLESNASPIVLKAKECLSSHSDNLEVITYRDWKVKL